jgi:hypothetical protein
MVCHAVLAGIALANDGTLLVSVGGDGGRARLDLRAEGSVPRRDEAAPHLEATRRLAEELGAEPSIDAEAAPVARLSLSFVHPR